MTPGRTGWLEVNAQRVTTSARFHADLFGWGMEPLHVPPFGSMPLLTAGGTAFANQFMAMGAFATPRWIAWVTGDLDRAGERAEALTGEAPARSRIPGNGARLDLRDPGGTPFGLIAPECPLPPDGAPGLPWALELWAPDGAARAPFHAEVLGMRAGTTGWGVALSAPGEAPRLFLRDTDFEIAPPRWIPHFRSASVPADVERARRLGAIVQVPEAEWPGMGRTAILSDPSGVVFGLIEPF